MEWFHVLSIILGNAAIFLPLWLWARGEANADRRDLTNLLIEMKDEMKDFHYRLLEIERGRK